MCANAWSGQPLNAVSRKQSGGDRPKLVFPILGTRLDVTPDRLGPAGIARPATDDMHMELRDQVADPGDIDSLAATRRGQPVRHPLAVGEHRIPPILGKVQQIGAVGLRDQNQPGDGSVLVRQQMCSR